MFGLSQTTGYAIVALSCLDSPQGRPRLVTDVADCTGIPRPYLWKVMHHLRRRGLVAAKRGSGGGIILAREAARISLADVAVAVEGEDWLPQCMIGLPDCSDLQICPTHEFWLTKRLEIEQELRSHSLASVAEHIRRSNFHAAATCGAAAPLIQREARKPRPKAKPAFAREMSDSNDAVVSGSNHKAARVGHAKLASPDVSVSALIGDASK
jgi:Rrf2 family transcriptional regulator, iron-sulfur cluster assembly transcription factor